MIPRPAGGEVYDELATGHLVDVSTNSLMLAVRLARQRRADRARRGWARSRRRGDDLSELRGGPTGRP